MIEEGWGDEMTEPCGTPCLHLAGRRAVLLVKARGLPAAEVCHQPSDQVVSESEAVDHIYKDKV